MQQVTVVTAIRQLGSEARKQVSSEFTPSQRKSEAENTRSKQTCDVQQNFTTEDSLSFSKSWSSLGGNPLCKKSSKSSSLLQAQ